MLPNLADVRLERLIAALNSIVDGELAVAMLIGRGESAIPYLECFLLAGLPRAIALPRCRAVHALGELSARPTLISYFRQYRPPSDAVVLFAEDAVRSAVAHELTRWKSDEVFDVLMDAAKRRATSGVILALGEFRRSASVPLLFEILEDDLCREDARIGLRKVPEAAHQYAILSIRGLTELSLDGPFTLRRRRATLQLLAEFGIPPAEWDDLSGFLLDNDADVVINTASIGLKVGPELGRSQIIRALFRVSSHSNWAQEDQITRHLEAYPDVALSQAQVIVNERRARGEGQNWLDPSWRILQHVLGTEPEEQHKAV
jgi:hypothetical protein